MGGGGEDKEEETDASRLDTAIVSKDLVRLCLELPPPSDSVHEDEKKVIGTGSYGVIYPHGPAQVVKVYKVCDEGLPSTSLDSCAEEGDEHAKSKKQEKPKEETQMKEACDEEEEEEKKNEEDENEDEDEDEDETNGQYALTEAAFLKFISEGETAQHLKEYVVHYHSATFSEALIEKHKYRSLPVVASGDQQFCQLVISRHGDDLKRSPPLWVQRGWVSIDICKALHAFQSNQLYHGDIKATNVLHPRREPFGAHPSPNIHKGLGEHSPRPSPGSASSYPFSSTRKLNIQQTEVMASNLFLYMNLMDAKKWEDALTKEGGDALKKEDAILREQPDGPKSALSPPVTSCPAPSRTPPLVTLCDLSFVSIAVDPLNTELDFTTPAFPPDWRLHLTQISPRSMEAWMLGCTLLDINLPLRAVAPTSPPQTKDEEHTHTLTELLWDSFFFGNNALWKLLNRKVPMARSGDDVHKPKFEFSELTYDAFGGKQGALLSSNNSPSPFKISDILYFAVWLSIWKHRWEKEDCFRERWYRSTERHQSDTDDKLAFAAPIHPDTMLRFLLEDRYGSYVLSFSPAHAPDKRETERPTEDLSPEEKSETFWRQVEQVGFEHAQSVWRWTDGHEDGSSSRPSKTSARKHPSVDSLSPASPWRLVPSSPSPPSPPRSLPSLLLPCMLRVVAMSPVGLSAVRMLRAFPYIEKLALRFHDVYDVAFRFLPANIREDVPFLLGPAVMRTDAWERLCDRLHLPALPPVITESEWTREMQSLCDQGKFREAFLMRKYGFSSMEAIPVGPDMASQLDLDCVKQLMQELKNRHPEWFVPASLQP